MTQYNEGNVKGFDAGEALAAFRRVKLDSSGDVVYSDAGEDWIGTTDEAVANGARVSVRLRTASGTRKMTAAGAFSINDVIYGADDGKVDDNPTGASIGRAFEAATADDDVVEVLSECDLSQAIGEVVEIIGGAGDIAALDLVYVSDQTDAVMTVLKAQSTSGGRLADFICPNAIVATEKGVALKSFLLQGIDTSGASAVGDEVYLSDSSAGGYTLTKPTATDKVQIVGRVVEKHATTGAILFDLSGPQQVVHDHSDASEGGDLGDHASGQITMADAKDIVTNTSTGTKIATAASQKLGFFGATPVVQESHVADPAATASAVGDLGATNSTPWGYDSEAHADDVHTTIDALVVDTAANKAAIDSILAQLASLGFQASS